MRMTGEGLVLTASPDCVKALRQDPVLRKQLARTLSEQADGTRATSPAASARTGLHPLQQLSARSHWADKPRDPYYGAQQR